MAWSRMQRVSAVAVGVVVIVGTAGVAYATGATIAGRQPAMIYVCQDKSTGVLRMVRPDEACKRSENRVQWDGRATTGPRGPQGVQGVQGQQGQQGPQGEIGPTGPASLPAVVEATWWSQPLARWDPVAARDRYLIGASPVGVGVGKWVLTGHVLVMWADRPTSSEAASFQCSVVINGDGLLSGHMFIGTLQADDTQGVMIPISGTLTVLNYPQALEVFCWNMESSGADLEAKDGSVVAIPALSVNGFTAD